MASPTITLRCPQCNRFLAEVVDFGRIPCPECGSETTYRSKQQRATERSAVTARST